MKNAASTDFAQLLSRLTQGGAVLSGGSKGIEKESLRVAADGRIAQTPHPGALGSALTNPYVTTDFSEALLEFITPPLGDTWELLQFLCDEHQFVCDHLDTDEVLWATSMPCALGDDASVPLAHYGSSNVGKMKRVYRHGLGLRYGRVMQAIAGVHFNYSLPQDFWPHWAAATGQQGDLQDVISAGYFGLIRNFHRWGWLVLYLFGASPAVCRSFAGAEAAGLDDFDDYTVCGPHATSLRMSDIGYSNNAQSTLAVSVNNMDEYIAGLTHAISTPHPDYERLGVRRNGEYQQLNANLIQIENEYYSLIRPKRVTFSGERPTLALARRGVEYVEVRALDVSVFDPVGTNQNEMRFLEALLVYCTLAPSPPVDPSEYAEIAVNKTRVAIRGREPGLKLAWRGGERPLAEWASEICNGVLAVAELIDGADVRPLYRRAAELQLERVRDPDATPSARVLEEMRSNRESFFEFAMRMSQSHQEYFRDLAAVSPERVETLVNAAGESRRQQAEIEASDNVDFGTYLADYFAQT